jgi:Xaa-Pro aminopeptidase
VRPTTPPCRRRTLHGAFIALLSGASLQAQFGFTTAFSPAEFAARRARVMEQIGEGVAVIHGSAEIPGSLNFRQNNQFFYLTGVSVPRAVLIIDGKARASTLFLPNRSEGMQRNDGPLLAPTEATARQTGIELVMTRDSVMAVLTRLSRDGRPVYAPFGGEVRGASYVSHVTAYDRGNALDPLDGRPSREQALIAKLAVLWGAAVQNLDPILNGLRAIKSPAEIAAIREASRVAGLALVEAMRVTRPGMYEYQLGAVADFVYRDNDAQGFGYGAIIATDTNATWGHYRLGRSRLGANDLVLMDYAPDINYYTSDVTRQWPVSGTFSPRQREMYTIYVRLFGALESSLKVGVPVRDILAEAVGKMDRIMAEYRFTDPKIKEAATRFVTNYRNSRATSFGHTVGMAVHDVAHPAGATLQPGVVFSIEPAFTIPDEKIYIRIENTYAVTATGVENLSPEAPIDPDAIEKLMRQRRPAKVVP